ncbi:MAG: transposase, partial [Planctomycetaceae bacterium]|nr:transposase [Planctomycetaceae bacterium]
MAQYKHYSKDFKLQAAKLVTEQGYSLTEAGRKLGVSA